MPTPTLKRKRSPNQRSPKKRLKLSIREPPRLPLNIVKRIFDMARVQRLRNIRRRLLNYRRTSPFASYAEMRMAVVANSIMENLNNPYTNAEVNGVIRRMRVMNQI